MGTFNEFLKLERENPRIGIVGGLGPETGFLFALNLNNRIVDATNQQPDILVNNVPMSKELDERLINGEAAQETLSILTESISTLNKADVDFIVIPCNSVHVFIDSLRRFSEKPVISIIEECAKECKRRKIKRAGLLASSTTVNEKLHEKELSKLGIRTVLPNKNEQEEISKVIIRILRNKAVDSDKIFLSGVIEGMAKDGAEAVILGCTDLQLLVKDSSLPIIDTLKVLEDSTVNTFLKLDKEVDY